MTPSSIAILTNPHPRGHIVYPYTDENLVGQAVCLFASSGLTKGDAIILIMADSHCDSIVARLAAEGFDVAGLQKSGQLNCISAEDLLAVFMIDGVLDEHLFKTIVGQLINNAKAVAGNGHPGQVRIFGEMVSLLWPLYTEAAERLEQLWNEAIDTHSVSLLCTYCLADKGHCRLPDSLMATHSHSI